ncbi:Apoptosis 1 inhibitor [Ooceraea biroi]|uniref:Apoptosis 1 inhibitor n=1 Tax=Ooceraea biroi TaxID=2015173 RepID=A0A026W4X5_OOCBI|nr:Apoptosis 1 inhibitor [Ooceraea biroi]
MDYRYESVRFESFKDWPVPYIRADRLAEAGFYYLGRDSAVKCFECELKILNWLEDQDPIIQHKLFSATCKFVNNVPCGNVPIKENYNPFSSSSTDQDVGQDVCGILDDSHGTFTSNVKNAKYPEYCAYRDRLNSFYSWHDRQWPHTREQLAEAGFFYKGNDDQTPCFHCGVRLRNWRPNEDPWQRHALVQPCCHYLLTIKGQKFAEQGPKYFYVKESQALPSRKPLAAIETQNQPGPSRAHQNQSSQRDIENISSNVAALSIIEEESEEGAACASNTGPPKPDKEDLPCSCCYSNRRNILFMTCHHVVACETCANKLDMCPICREKIQFRYKICIPRSL